MQEFKIGSHTIGLNAPPFIIAELSGNHNGSLENGLKLIHAAKEAGVHAVKLQTYTPDTITLNIHEGDFVIRDPKSLWNGRILYDLYKEAYTPWDWHKPLLDYCHELGLIGFSTPFDETAVDFLETLNVPCYKIASPEIVDLPLIEKVAKLGKPMLISTGGASIGEIEDAVTTAKNAGCEKIVLLKCTAAYPARSQDMNLRTLEDMQSRFGTLVGLSDHSLTLGVPVASVALGACCIEKHFTLSRKEGGVDSAFSLEPHEFQALVKETHHAWQALGQVNYTPLPSEATTLKHRPSLYFVSDLKKGSIIKPEDIRSVRPASGLPPKETSRIIGKTVKTDVSQGTPVHWKLIQDI